MINFNKLEDNLLNELNIANAKEAYTLEKDGTIIGYGIITNFGTNKIEIFVKEQYRSNGYGKILFEKMLTLLKNKEYKEIKITFARDNYRIKSIIETFGGLQLHTDDEKEIYLIPIK